MNLRKFQNGMMVCSGIAALCSCSENAPKNTGKPNIVILLADDQGYGDAACYGNPDLQTPNLDALAASGTLFTDFCAGASSSTPSRAALLTGRYAERTGLPKVVDDRSANGLNPDELTIADYLKQNGYATGIFGKWHLGCLEEHLPLRHGFDEFFGIPYSNDMWKFHPAPDHPYRALPLYNNEDIVEYDPEVNSMTAKITERAVDFIERHSDDAFFLYLPYTQPHVPLGVSERFKGKSGQGLYADVIMEIDWSVGEIVKALKKAGIEKNTLVIFTSDNGPWLCYGNHAGSNGGLREGKGTTFEGGQRVPMIVSMPGSVPEGKVSRQFFSGLDIAPTVLGLTSSSMPRMNPFDGENVWDLLCGKEFSHKPFFYIHQGNVEAVRDGDWKFVREHAYRIVTEPGKDGLPGKQLNKGGYTGDILFNIADDYSEQNDLSGAYPAETARLKNMVDSMTVVIDGVCTR